MKIYYVRTNAYDMLIADHGDHRHYINECDTNGFENRPQSEEDAVRYLISNADGLGFNSHDWDQTEETVDELTNWQGTEILAKIDA